MKQIIIGLLVVVAAIIAFFLITGKKVAATGAAASDIFSGFLQTDAAEIAANPDVLNDPLRFHDPTTDVQKSSIPAGTYVSAKDAVYGAPLAFEVVGGADIRPEKGISFGASSGGGYGGISASKEGAGAAGYRSGSGTWTSTGFQRSD